MNRFLQSLLVSRFSYALLLFVVLGHGVPPLGADEGRLLDMRDRGESAISFMLEEGTIVPTQVLFDLKDLDLREQGMKPEVIMTVLRGEASFAAGSREVYAPVREGGVVMPELVAGPIGDETFIRVAIQGKRLFPDLRFVTLRAGGVEALKQLIAKLGDIGEGATLAIAEHYVVVDMNRLDYSKLELYESSESESIPGPTPLRPVPRGGFFRFNDPDFDCNESECSRDMQGPGLVVWLATNPWERYKYSVKPESADYLITAQYPEQAIDGIYHPSYGDAHGCGIALKVPDSCTATVSNPSFPIHCCCNSILRFLLGIECSVLNTHDFVDWPDCAL